MLGEGRKYRKDIALSVAEWNVRTLMDRSASHRPERQTALVAMEMERYGIDVAALSETRLPGYDSIEDHGYVFFWSGRSLGEKREAGVGFALRKDIAATLVEEPTPVNERIMTMRLPLQRKMCATFISVYAPTMTNSEEVKERFYSDLRDTISHVPADDRLILVGDFNARTGSDYGKWKGVLGSHGVGKCNANGELLLALCSEYSLVITNTIFKHKEAHKNTWMHPRSKHWHLLDYVIFRQRDLKEVMDTRAMRGADCGTDHVMLRSRMMIKRKVQHKSLVRDDHVN
jgi:exonuclease III